MALGYRKHLEAEDLWDLCRRDEAQVVVDTFQRSLETTMKPVSAPQVCLEHTCCLRCFQYLHACALANNLFSYRDPYREQCGVCTEQNLHGRG